jgi:hypothetical protein
LLCASLHLSTFLHHLFLPTSHSYPSTFTWNLFPEFE